MTQTIVNPYAKKKKTAPPQSLPAAASKSPVHKKHAVAPPRNQAVVTPGIASCSIKKRPPVQQQQHQQQQAPLQLKKAVVVSSSAVSAAARATATTAPSLVTPKKSTLKKKKNSLKQQLKQEIALLKKRKTLQRLQQEADRRRLQQQKEKEAKLKQIQEMQQERQRIKEEKHKQKMEALQKKEEERLLKQQERQRKVEEKQKKEQERIQREQEAYQRFIWNQQQQQQQQQQQLQLQQVQQYYAQWKPDFGVLYNGAHTADPLAPQRPVMPPPPPNFTAAPPLPAPTSTAPGAMVQTAPAVKKVILPTMESNWSPHVANSESVVLPPTKDAAAAPATTTISSSLSLVASAPTADAPPPPNVAASAVEPKGTENAVPVPSNVTSANIAMAVPGNPPQPLVPPVNTPEVPPPSAPVPQEHDIKNPLQYAAIATALAQNCVPFPQNVMTQPVPGLQRPVMALQNVLPHHPIAASSAPMLYQRMPLYPTAPSMMNPFGHLPPHLLARNMMQQQQNAMRGIPFAPIAPPRPIVPAGFNPAVPYSTLPWQRPPRRPLPPRPKPIQPTVLCAPMEAHSPFSHYQLLKIDLVRPTSEKSFGVNLKLFHQSTLVDPEWLEQQQQQQQGAAKKLIASQPSLGSDTSNNKSDVATSVASLKKETNEMAAKDAKSDALPTSATKDDDATSISLNLPSLDKAGSEHGDKMMVVPKVSALEKIETNKLGSNENQVFVGERLVEKKAEGDDATSDTQMAESMNPQEASFDSSNSSPNARKTIVAVKDEPVTLEKLEQPKVAHNPNSAPAEGTRTGPTMPTAAVDLSARRPDSGEAETQTIAEAPNSALAEKSRNDAGMTKSTVDDGATRPDRVMATAASTTASKSPEKESNAVAPMPIDPISTEDKTPASKPSTRKRRRRRVNFSVMLVVDVEKQNKFREDAGGGDDKGELLQPGDLIISIGGIAIAGMAFAQACATFATKAERVGESMICAKLLVARRPKPVAQPVKVVTTKALPNVAPAATVPQPALSIPRALPAPATNSDFQENELALLADCVVRAIHNPSRLLGQPLAVETAFDPMTSLYQRIATLKHFKYDGEALPVRSIPALQSWWIDCSREIDSDLRKKHQERWTQAIEAEGGAAAVTFASDAERSGLRLLPRPVKGCRCKRNDHEYLHDPKCLLYRDIRSLVPKHVLSLLLKSEEKFSKKKDIGLNVVEKGFKDRIVRLKKTAGMEEAEARFVAFMEDVQVKQCKKAVFAPTSLAAMILSAVFELQREFPVSHVVEDDTEDEEEDDDEEADVPLAMMLEGGKRKAPTSLEKSQSKRHKQMPGSKNMISLPYLIRMFQYISKVWGHVYREPYHKEYAWRWEMYHGHNSEDGQWGSQSRNPRQPNSLSFAAFQSGGINANPVADISLLGSIFSNYDCSIQREFDKATTVPERPIASSPVTYSTTCAASLSGTSKIDAIEGLQSGPPIGPSKSPEQKDAIAVKPEPMVPALPSLNFSRERAEYCCFAAHLLSPSSSGLYDELMALVKMEVLKTHSSGIPFLSRDWFLKVDILVLDDMDRCWGSDADPEGRFCIDEEMRDTLEEQWVKSDYGWSTADDPNDLVFDFEVIDEWREAFQGQMEEKANCTEGVGRFGL